MSNKDIYKKCNVIEQMAVSELLDDRTFFIPSYQRGYRWTKTQIYDLCNDLLEYALRKDKDQKAFYSLQPLIVRRTKRQILGEEMDVFEVIDGQQRLTSIFILFRTLMKPAGYSNNDLEEYKDIKLYNIYYETRPNDYLIFKKLGLEPIKKCEIKDIDIAHIVNAYNYINQWLDNEMADDPECARSTWDLFSKEKYNKRDVASIIINLLTNAQETSKSEGNAQFIWYEIDADKDAIQEFLSENKGKISLTDTEKIRALFMQRKGREEVNDLIQHGIAKDWELIENTLHSNDFWSFISNDTSKEDGRIDIIFKYIYDRDCKDKKYQGDDYLFRYYYQLFNSRASNSSIIVDEWNKVMEAFRMLQNWYHNPRVYNLVGLLTKEQGVSKIKLTTKAIADIYDADDVITTEDFITKLKQKVCEVIVDNIPIDNSGNEELDVEGEYIKLFFNDSADKKKISGLLRFINVNVLCEQIEKLLEDVDKPEEEKKASDIGRSNRDEQCSIYRFPFEALDAFGWDIEHIDSATTNSLTDPKEQERWIEESESALDSILAEDEYYKEQKVSLTHAAKDSKRQIISNLLKVIRSIIGEDDSDKRKNWIGNLTLLDCGTNRMYKNKIFALKRSIIHERVNRGVYVPVCTQNIFNKTYLSCTKNNLRWDINDKKCYHNFILDQINSFKKKYHK